MGVTTDAPGAWADLLAAHDSMLIPVPDARPRRPWPCWPTRSRCRCTPSSDHPPPPGGKALVYGAGALGVTSVAALRALYPDVEVAVVARFAAQAELATASRRGQGGGPRAAPGSWSRSSPAWSGGVLHTPFDGLPSPTPAASTSSTTPSPGPRPSRWACGSWPSAAPSSRAACHTPGRWEWTPIYFKELTIAGSNAFGIEEVEGVRKHAIAHYLDLAASGRVDLTGMLTHRFPLEGGGTP